MARLNGALPRHQIREDLLRMILSGERRPKSRLHQKQLAEQFGVATGLVREALLELQAYGLVETVDHRGVFVGEIDNRRLLESFDVRSIHEGLAARLCCESATRAELRTLAELARNVYALGQLQRLDEMSSGDREFHSRLVHLSGNRMLIRLAENYRVLGKFIRAKSNRDAGVVLEEHLAIVAAIEDGNATDAERLAREHVAAAKVVLETSLASSDFEPQWIV